MIGQALGPPCLPAWCWAKCSSLPGLPLYVSAGNQTQTLTSAQQAAYQRRYPPAPGLRFSLLQLDCFLGLVGRLLETGTHPVVQTSLELSVTQAGIKLLASPSAGIISIRLHIPLKDKVRWLNRLAETLVAFWFLFTEHQPFVLTIVCLFLGWGGGL